MSKRTLRDDDMDAERVLEHVGSIIANIRANYHIRWDEQSVLSEHIEGALQALQSVEDAIRHQFFYPSSEEFQRAMDRIRARLTESK